MKQVNGRLNFTGPLLIYFTHSALLHLVRGLATEVALYELLYQVYERGKHYCHYEFVGIVDEADGQNTLIAPPLTDLKTNKEHYKTINQLGDNRGAGCPQPNFLLASYFFYAMKNPHINQLADEKGYKAAGNDPHALPENISKRCLHIRNA